MKNIISLIVDNNDIGQRVDSFIKKKQEKLSRTRIKNLILKEKLKFNNKILDDPSKKISFGDKIDLEEGAFSSNWKTGLRISYQFSNKISGGLRYEYRETDSRTMGQKIDRDFGFDINIAIAG